MSQHLSIVIAGTTGLVGKSTLDIALDSASISHIYSLSRHAIKIDHEKLTQWLDPELNPPSIDTLSALPTVGVIALGSTIKKAGSKARLHAIDVELVVNVAKNMHALGVQHIIAVSCIGASTSAGSHYLRCKGEMEVALQQIDFKQVSFMQPGPLSGVREEPRTDEKLLQSVMKVIGPLMIGPLVNYKPIESSDVAAAIVQLATEQLDVKEKKIQRITSSQMMKLVRQQYAII